MPTSARLARPFESDHARGVRGEGEVAELQHDIEPHRPVVRVAGLAVELQPGGFDLRLRHVHPFHLPLHAQFGLAHGGEVFGQLGLVGAAELLFERLRLGEDVVEDAPLFGVTPERGFARGGVVGDEEALEEPLRTVLGGERRAVAIEGERVAVQRGAGAGLIADLERREAGLRADLFRDHLIDGNRVGVVLARHRLEIGAGEPCVAAAVAAGASRMAEPGEHAEICAVLLQRLERGRELVVRGLSSRAPIRGCSRHSRRSRKWRAAWASCPTSRSGL